MCGDERLKERYFRHREPGGSHGDEQYQRDLSRREEHVGTSSVEGWATRTRSDPRYRVEDDVRNGSRLGGGDSAQLGAVRVSYDPATVEAKFGLLAPCWRLLEKARAYLEEVSDAVFGVWDGRSSREEQACLSACRLVTQMHQCFDSSHSLPCPDHSAPASVTPSTLHTRNAKPCPGVRRQNQLRYMSGLIQAHLKKPMTRDQVTIYGRREGTRADFTLVGYGLASSSDQTSQHGRRGDDTQKHEDTLCVLCRVVYACISCVVYRTLGANLAMFHP